MSSAVVPVSIRVRGGCGLWGLAMQLDWPMIIIVTWLLLLRRNWVSFHRLGCFFFHQPPVGGPCYAVSQISLTDSCRRRKNKANRPSRGSSLPKLIMPPLSRVYVAMADTCGSPSCQPWTPRGDLFDQLKTWDRQIGGGTVRQAAAAAPAALPPAGKAAAAAQAHQTPLVTALPALSTYLSCDPRLGEVPVFDLITSLRDQAGARAPFLQKFVFGGPGLQ